MRIRKITAGLLGGVMAASILAGCGGINKDEVVALSLIHISEPTRP